MSSRNVFYRLLDNGSQTFSISFLLGLIWGEILLVTSGRLLAMRAAGLSFRRRLQPVLYLSMAAICVQFTLTNFARPYAVMALSKQGLANTGSSTKPPETTLFAGWPLGKPCFTRA